MGLNGIFGGLIVYQEFVDFKNTRNIFVFTVGCIILTAGILYLTTLKETGRQQQERRKSIHQGTEQRNVNDIVSVMSHTVGVGVEIDSDSEINEATMNFKNGINVVNGNQNFVNVTGSIAPALCKDVNNDNLTDSFKTNS